MPRLIENDVIQHGNAKSFAGLFKLPGEPDVLLAWSEVAGGMIVSKNDRRGTVGDWIGKDLARMYLSFVDQADGNDADSDDFMCSVQRNT